MLRQTLNSSTAVGFLIALCSCYKPQRMVDSSRVRFSLPKLQLIFCRCLYRRPREITHLLVVLAWCVSYKCSVTCKPVSQPETAVLPSLPLQLAASYWFQGSQILSGYPVLVQISFYWGLAFCRQHLLFSQQWTLKKASLCLGGGCCCSFFIKKRYIRSLADRLGHQKNKRNLGQYKTKSIHGNRYRGRSMG